MARRTSGDSGRLLAPLSERAAISICSSKWMKAERYSISSLLENVPESFAVFRLPTMHRQRLRTTNMLERINRELKRRTRVATLFPNEASLLRLVTAVLMELSEEWETGKRYVTFETK